MLMVANPTFVLLSKTSIYMHVFQSADGRSASKSSSAAQKQANKKSTKRNNNDKAKQSTNKPVSSSAALPESSSDAQPSTVATKLTVASGSAQKYGHVGSKASTCEKAASVFDLASLTVLNTHYFVIVQQPNTSMSPSPKPLDHHMPPCEHDNKEAFQMHDDKSYFAKKYLENTPLWPRSCAKEGCGNIFGINYKVGISRPVYFCINAKNKHHPCVHAYCKPCFDEWQAASENTPRKRRRRDAH